MSTPAQRLTDLLAAAGDDAPLGLAVALLAADEDPSVEPEAVLALLDDVARGLFIREDAPVVEAVARVNMHLFGTHGFEGDSESYHDPLNSLLHRVIERKRGLPILLSVLYIEVAGRAGLEVDGVGYPGHFIVRPRRADPAFYVDPFHGGEVRRADALEARLDRLVPATTADPELRAQFLERVDTRYILARMTNNLRASYMRRGDGPGLLRSIDRLRVLQPAEPTHQRDRGLVLLGLGDTEAGVAELRAYLDAHPDAPEAEVLREQVRGALAGD